MKFLRSVYLYDALRGQRVEGRTRFMIDLLWCWYYVIVAPKGFSHRNFTARMTYELW